MMHENESPHLDHLVADAVPGGHAIIKHNHQVDMLDPVTANFLGDNLRCWMQIQVTLLPNPPKYKYNLY